MGEAEQAIPGLMRASEGGPSKAAPSALEQFKHRLSGAISKLHNHEERMHVLLGSIRGNQPDPAPPQGRPNADCEHGGLLGEFNVEISNLEHAVERLEEYERTIRALIG